MTNPSLPSGLARATRVPHTLLSWGVPMGPLALLRTRGRRSGLPRAVPVATLRHDNLDWLVSPFGVTQWVRNVRTNGDAELGHGRRWQSVTLIEIDDNDKADVLYRYRRRFGFVSFVRRAFDATPSDGPAAFRTEANRHPVFLIQPRD